MLRYPKSKLSRQSYYFPFVQKTLGKEGPRLEEDTGFGPIRMWICTYYHDTLRTECHNDD